MLDVCYRVTGYMSGIVDDEIQELLEKKKMEILQEITGKERCCRIPVESGYDIVDLGEFKNILESCRIAVVLFYTTTCPYCRAFAPVFVSVGEEFSGKAAFIAVNLERFPTLASYYNIMGTPTVIVFVDGRPYTGFSGMVDPERFYVLVENVLREASCS